MSAHTAAPARPPSRLELKFRPDGNVTRMSVLTQQPPWRALRAFANSQGQALVHLHNVSGGIVAGDSLRLSIEAAPRSRVQATSVGATRIYRTAPGRPAAYQSTVIHVGDGAMIEFLPDPIIPFAGSRFSQTTTVQLGVNAGFIGWETLAAGRVASGEVFSFDSFRSECSIYSQTRPLALERYSLAPSLRPPESSARWGRFRYSASLYVCHTGVPSARWLQLESELNHYCLQSGPPAARWGASALIESGILIRGLAMDAHQITTGLHAFWEQAKRRIWDEPAVLPRKIN